MNRKVIEMVCAGAGIAAHEMAPYIAKYNSTSERYEIAPHYVAPDPGQLAALDHSTQALGVRATFEEGTIEEHLDRESTARSPIVLHLDRPGSVHNVLDHPAADRRPIIGYMIIGRPDGFIAGMATSLTPDRSLARQRLSDATAALEAATVHEGSSSLIGVDAPIRNQLIEPMLRRYFAEHLFDQLPKVAFGLEPATAPVELTLDGRRKSPLVILDSRTGWRGIADIGPAVLDQRLAPLRPGSSLAVMEIGPENEQGVRIYPGRYQRNRQVAVGGAVCIDPATIADLRERERMRRQQEEALERMARQSATPTNAFQTTD